MTMTMYMIGTFKVSAQVRSLPSKTARPILGKSLSCHNVDDEVDLEDEVEVDDEVDVDEVDLEDEIDN